MVGCLLGSSVGVGAACAQQVELRSGQMRPAGEVLAITVEGVLLGEAGQPEIIVPWAEVRSTSAEANDQWKEVADLAWRAELRLKRGDTVTAEPMFERLLVLLDQHRTTSSQSTDSASNGGIGQGPMPTTERALRGLMECQLARGARDRAIVTWSEWLTASQAGTGDLRVHERDGSWEGAGDHLGLLQFHGDFVHRLGPFWMTSDEPPMFAAQPVAEGTTLGGSMLAWYRSAARQAAGLTPEYPEARATHPGVLFVRDLVLAQAADSGLRQSARSRLEQRLEEEAGQWPTAWLHMAIGRSLLSEPDRGERDRGLVHLLRVPAAWAVGSPELAELALREVAHHLGVMGELDAQQVVESELRRFRLARSQGQEVAR